MPIILIFADMIRHFNLIAFIVCLLSSCAGRMTDDVVSSCRYARWFDIIDDGKAVVLISPYDLHRDTVHVGEPMDNIICMSSSQVAALASIGADSAVTAVSGIGYITNPRLRERYIDGQKPLYDIGYESSLDYERILNLKPDILLAYTVSGAEPQFLKKLRSLGVPVAVLHDHLEDHPLARAEYIRLAGVLTGHHEAADSLFNHVCDSYLEISGSVPKDVERIKVLMNIPYADAWYIPGGDSYMSHLICDAGGEILGAVPGRESRVISMEQAYRLSVEADMWLNPGYCRSLEELSQVHQLFPHFGPVKNNLPIYNNTLRTTPEGGNDFWESGSVRPDLILNDLVNLIQGKDSLYYFFRLE